jgi:hypothetical protein
MEISKKSATHPEYSVPAEEGIRKIQTECQSVF